MKSKTINALRDAYHMLASHDFDLFITVNFFHQWDADYTFRKLAHIDAVVCRILLGRNWHKKELYRPYFVAFYEKTIANNAHCHLYVKIPPTIALDLKQYSNTFKNVVLGEVIVPNKLKKHMVDWQIIDRTPGTCVDYGTSDIAKSDYDAWAAYYSHTFSRFSCTRLNQISATPLH